MGHIHQPYQERLRADGLWHEEVTQAILKENESMLILASTHWKIYDSNPGTEV